MCGIIGIVSSTGVADRLVDGLRRMEYRGYDSAGICTLHDGQMVRRRAEGKLLNLVGRRLMARLASPIRAGPRMARRRRRTHTPMPPAKSPSCTTELSKISRSCGLNSRRQAGPLKAKPIAKSSRISSRNRSRTGSILWRRCAKYFPAFAAHSRWPLPFGNIPTCLSAHGSVPRLWWVTARTRCSSDRTRSHLRP